MRRTFMALFGIIILMMSATAFASLCGDVNSSGAVNTQDIAYLINYLYKGGPVPLGGDVNGSGAVDIRDATYLINFLYKGGPALVCVTVTDIDGNIYQTVTIGGHIWMAENLKVTHYRNGEAIPNVTDPGTWLGLTTGAYCEYNNDVNNVATYGRLYNWYAVADSRNIAPEGWHVPTDVEWRWWLVYYLGGDSVAGGKMKETGTTHWISPNTGATNKSGFFGLPGGYRGVDILDKGRYKDMGIYGVFWSSTESTINNAWTPYLYYTSSHAERFGSDKRLGFSVRCVKD